MKTYTFINYSKGHTKFFYNIINQIRGAIYQVPSEQFSETLLCLVESHITDVAVKFMPIVEKVSENGILLETFKTDQDRIRLLWSLLLLEKANEIISSENIKEMINSIQIKNLDAYHFRLFIQILNLSLAEPKFQNSIDYDKFYSDLEGLPEEFKQEIVNSDTASKTQDDVRIRIRNEVDEVLNHQIKKAVRKRGKFIF